MLKGIKDLVCGNSKNTKKELEGVQNLKNYLFAKGRLANNFNKKFNEGMSVAHSNLHKNIGTIQIPYTDDLLQEEE